MGLIAFDTLAYARRLKDAGVSAQQAEAMSEAQAESLEALLENRLATKDDVHELMVGIGATRSELKEEITGVRGEMAFLRTELKEEIAEVRGEMASLRTELKEEIAEVRGEMASLRTELKEDLGQVRTEVERMGRTIAMWMVGLFIGMATLMLGGFFTLFRLLAP